MCRKDCRETSTCVCVHERERGGNAGRGWTSSPMLAVHGLAHTQRLGLGKGRVLDLVMGWVLLQY